MKTWIGQNEYLPGSSSDYANDDRIYSTSYVVTAKRVPQVVN
jgi:hypothetical protein